MRLLCNLFDGMVAVEHNKVSSVGEIYNDVPDRVADLLIIVGVGYAVRDFPYAIEAAWLGACLAIFTAYIRVLGKSLGTDSCFVGPMAKPHRMALLTICSFLEMGNYEYSPLYIALIVLNFGTVITIFRRLIVISKEKKEVEING